MVGHLIAEVVEVGDEGSSGKILGREADERTGEVHRLQILVAENGRVERGAKLLPVLLIQGVGELQVVEAHARLQRDATALRHGNRLDRLYPASLVAAVEIQYLSIIDTCLGKVEEVAVVIERDQAGELVVILGIALQSGDRIIAEACLPSCDQALLEAGSDRLLAPQAQKARSFGERAPILIKLEAKTLVEGSKLRIVKIIPHQRVPFAF
ncbi:hypothetical protein SDC9_101958 [bioreactor metagenome]|uniref:Uncharacterized protein n=1 Tax=bioreactor metagenome TaxID=1076179 RepID=A0A645API1_9ZZZZ